ncbi:MAG: hypothetical protein OXC99_09775 [Chloroflexi bacterium]|nr:hypothetical protein [Chloroflexota bacterium]
MLASDGETRGPTPQESRDVIYETLERTRSSLYVAGSATILILWGVIGAVGLLAEYSIATWGADLRADYPWISGPLWMALVGTGFTASAVIGSRAGQRAAPGQVSRDAGLRVFLFWLAIGVAAFALPGLGGAWASDNPDVNTPRVAIGVAGLGFVLFGIMVRPMLAVIGAGLLAAYYVPSYLLDDAALAVSAALWLAVAALGMLWVRKSGIA